jgi:hypothetical protein
MSSWKENLKDNLPTPGSELDTGAGGIGSLLGHPRLPSDSGSCPIVGARRGSVAALRESVRHPALRRGRDLAGSRPAASPRPGGLAIAPTIPWSLKYARLAMNRRDFPAP